jgi:uncharacterized protein
MKKGLLSLVFFTVLALIVNAQERAYINVSKSPYVKVKSLDMGNVKWTDGFWKERFDLCQANVIPAQWNNFMWFTQHNFEIVANKLNDPDGYRGAFWQDGDYYKWLEAQVGTYAITKDTAIANKIERAANLIARAQATDGYITMNTQIGFGKSGKGKDGEYVPYKNSRRFAHAGLHETYNMGHLMTLACTYYRVTGSRTLLDVAIKAANFLDQYFAVITPELSRIDFNPTHITGLTELYRTTGDKKYLILAQRFVDARGRGGEMINQNKTPFREEREAVGHAVLANYLYCGAADIYAETGEKALMESLEAIWEDSYLRKSSITGGLGNQHFMVTSGNQKDLTHESFGYPFKLENSTAYNETCANFGGAYFSWRMFLLTGEPKYLDKMENTFYNNLSSMSLDGKSYFYTNPMRWYGKEHTLLSQDYHGRWTRIGCVCCPTSVARFLTESNDYAYGMDGNSLYVILYGSNEVIAKIGKSTLKFIQKSDYPWHGNIIMIYDGDKNTEFSLKMRIPSWAEGATMKVNGQEQMAQPSTFAEINRKWNKGDKVELNLPLKPIFVEANPRVEEARNQVAVTYGPLVYCVEEIDLPAGFKIDNIVLPITSELTAEYKKELLGGVVTISGDALQRTNSFDKKNLYAPVNTQLKPFKLQFIPYYSWANRGEYEMSVYLPVKW